LTKIIQLLHIAKEQYKNGSKILALARLRYARANLDEKIKKLEEETRIS